MFPIDVSVSSDLPISAGLGSSASYSISLIAAILTSLGYISTIKTNTTTIQIDKLMQDFKTPSRTTTTTRTQIDQSDTSSYLNVGQESNSDSSQTCNLKRPQNEQLSFENINLQIGCQTKRLKFEQSENSFSSDTLHVIVGWAYEAEKLLHGKPSGIDNSIGTLGMMKLFWYFIAPIHLNMTSFTSKHSSKFCCDNTMHIH